MEKISFNYAGPKPPCVQNCPNRNASCHATCEAYKKYEEEKQMYYAQRNAERDGMPYWDNARKAKDDVALRKMRGQHSGRRKYRQG